MTWQRTLSARVNSLEREFEGPLREESASALTAIEMHPQACLQDDFAWRVKMTPHMILLLPFLIPGEKLVPCRGMSGKRGAQGTFP